MILIISFNARAIAQLARKLGLEIIVVDFWGDQDLLSLVDKVYTVFKPEFKSYQAFRDQKLNEEKLVDLASQVICTEKIDAVLIGSGLDDRPDLWKKINSMVPILGNSPDCIKTVRNLLAIHRSLKKNNIKFPLTQFVKDITQIHEFTDQIGFPCVFKPLKTLGGMGIRLIRNESDLFYFLKKDSDLLNKYYIQEYIRGENISATIVGNKSNFKVLSINKQLIGIKKYGTNLPFKYCGNIIPLNCPINIAQKIENVSIKISKKFKLTGIFGIDFVLKENEPFFMEINPRFPGTIELLAMISELNPVKLHLDAIQGIIPSKIGTFQ